MGGCSLALPDALPRLGVLFSPLLPAVQILRLLLLFYIKKVVTWAGCGGGYF